MKKQVSKAPKVALCRVCHGTGIVSKESKAERAVKKFLPSANTGGTRQSEQAPLHSLARYLAGFRGTPEIETCVCPNCEGSGRVTVSAEIELDIRPYKPKE